MANLSDRQMAEMQYHLQTAVQGCIDRCLFHAAKWYVGRLVLFSPKYLTAYSKGC